jgi:hypothetical protein
MGVNQFGAVAPEAERRVRDAASLLPLEAVSVDDRAALDLLLDELSPDG